jgi:hypothetical protein
MQTKELLERIDLAIAHGIVALTTRKPGAMGSELVETGKFVGFRTIALSIISEIVGENNTYYKEFDRHVNDINIYKIESGINILQNLRIEIERGWLIKIKQLVTAEIFSDFLEMSKYLLDAKYKDPAAVMIGSVLEEHLRQLCTVKSIDITVVKGSDVVPKKADLMNSDLCKANVYGNLEQKNVTAWLDLRNKAAHGKYSEYTIEHVEIMYLGVLNFVTNY